MPQRLSYLSISQKLEFRFLSNQTLSPNPENLWYPHWTRETLLLFSYTQTVNLKEFEWDTYWSMISSTVLVQSKLTSGYFRTGKCMIFFRFYCRNLSFSLLHKERRVKIETKLACRARSKGCDCCMVLSCQEFGKILAIYWKVLM